DVRQRLKKGAYLDTDHLRSMLTPKTRDKPPVDSLFYDRSQIPKYLLQRGFTKKFLVEKQVGYDPYPPSAVIPIRDESGKLVGLARRIIQPGDGPKYLYPENFDRTSVDRKSVV